MIRFIFTHTLAFFIGVTGVILAQPSPIEYKPEKPFTVVYEDDCYVGKDYTIKVLPAHHVEKLALEIIERKLP